MRGSYGAWASRWRVPLGFAFAAAFVVLSRPARPWLIAGSVIALAGLLLRGVAAGHIRKSEVLATSGPFRYTRNPLYLGTLILGAGFVVASASWILGIAFVVMFFSVYIPVMRREAEFLRGKFGPPFEDYAERVPLFLPVPGRSFPSNGRFRWKQYVKNREYEAAAGWCVIFIFLLVKMMMIR